MYGERKIVAISVGVGFEIAAGALVFVAAAGGGAASRFGLAPAIALLFLPVFVSGPVLPRGLLAFTCAVILACAVEFASGSAPNGFFARLIYALAFLAFVDTSRPKTAVRRFNWAATARILASIAVAVAAIQVWRISATSWVYIRYVLRCLCAGALALALAEVTTDVAAVITAMLGVTLPPVHDAPYRSRSITEFWSRRWNVAASKWLRTHCFRPVIRYGAIVALCVTFFVSAALHAYIVATVDFRVALSWAAFFITQPLLILMEHGLKVTRWPASAARLWTFAALLLCLPLLVGPVLRLFHTAF